MKLFARPKCFSEAVALVTNLNYLFGLRIFEYPSGHPRPLLSLIYLLFMYGLYCGGSLRVEQAYYANVRLMKLEYVLYGVLSYVIVISVILKMLLGWWHTKKFKVCHKKIFEIDETLRKLGLSPNYNRIYFATIGTVITWITGSFIMCIVVFIHLKIRTDMFNSIYIVLEYTYSVTVNAINVFEFYIFVRCLQMKFKSINQLLCESLINSSTNKMKLGSFALTDYAKIIRVEQRRHTLSTKTIFQWNRRVLQPRKNVSMLEKQDPIISQIKSHSLSPIEKQFQSDLRNRSQNPVMTKCQERKYLLQIIKQVHLELCKISKIICHILGIQLAWEIGVTIMFLIGAFFNLYVRYFQHHKVPTLAEQTSMTLVMSFVSILKAIGLSRICKIAADEGNRTIELIHAIYGCDASTDMQEEIQQFGIQILQSPVTFSVFGLTLDNRLLSLILKTVTINLVIMVQSAAKAAFVRRSSFIKVASGVSRPSAKMFQPKTIQEMIMPLLVANIMVGMGIWASKRGRLLNIAYSLICLVTYCALMKLSIEYLEDYYLHKVNSLGNMTFQAIFYANICLTLCLIPCGWLRRKYMKAAMMRIMMCEKSMEQMGLQKNYRKLYLNQLYSLIFVVVIFIIFIVVNYDGMFVEDTPMHIRIVIIIAVNYPVGLLYVSDVSFLHWVSFAKTRFEQLNNLLQRMLTTTPDSPQHKRVLKMKDEWNKTYVASATQQDRTTKDNTDTMRAVKQVHLELIKSTRSMNEAYGIQILLSMTVSFVFITSLLYYAYSIFWMHLSSELFRQEMIPVVGWILFYSSKVLVINHMCAMATIEAANTGDIICELYEPSTTKEFRAEIRDFTLQLIQNPLIFTACGFFNLDHTFIHGVIGSVTTYLVILIQVGDLPTGKPTNSTINGTNLTMPDIFTTIAP
ncbi:PREDICTED: uncharacterized protein LOC105448726 [Wasmannia auropunctata]|uniref:uncharacterized protein LOC105448726 n=1 Tax=Wasmannia auropunctata TaxID=64793 RepID=UPI0005ED75E7|nr:PREDICTED: uncharacterized protein LOC105448726 [Wasmannia auropunctata]